MGQPAYRKALLLCLAAATEATKVSERKWKAAADEALATFKPIRKSVNSCVEIKILRRVRPESPRRPPRHRRLLDSVAVSVPHRSTEPERQRHHREMT